MGYTRAGFRTLGVDNEPHPDYPYGFHQGDARRALTDLLEGAPLDFTHPDGNVEWITLAEVAVIVGSPPCKRFTDLAVLSATDHPDLLTPFRALVQAWGGPYVIENVEGAPLRAPLVLCGSEFDLSALCRDGTRRQLRRHRLFESNVWLMGLGGCRHRGQPVGVYGEGGGGQMTRGYKAHPEEAREAMGIDWMRREDICQAIPPRFTEHVGWQVMDHITRDAA